MKKLIRRLLGIAPWLLVVYLGVFAYNRYQVLNIPILPKSDWPRLEIARAAADGKSTVVVEDDILVNQLEQGVQYCYCDIAADPKHPNRLFASSLVETPKSKVPGLPHKLSNVAGFYSHDGGRSWTRAFYLVADTGNPDTFQRETYSDPTVCWGTDGSVHFAVLHEKGFEKVFVPKKQFDKPWHEYAGADFWRSVDEGVTWEKIIGVSYQLDRPFTVVDTTSGPRSGRQYTIAQDRKVFVFTNHQDDKVVGEGKTLQEFLNPRPSNPVILSDGTVLIAVEEQARTWKGNVRPDAARWISTFRSVDGDHFVEGTPVNTQWSHPSFNNNGRPTMTFFPRLGANDGSSRFVDYVYCVWAGNRDIDVGLRHIDGEQIFVSVARDGGKTWGQPTILSEQPLGSNRDDDYLTALPSVAVNREGVVAVTWYDRRGLPKFDARQRVNDWNVRARISVDGGASWLPSVQLNQVLSKGEFDVGHTAGLTASSDGRFHALWIDARDGTRQLRTTSFRVE